MTPEDEARRQFKDLRRRAEERAAKPVRTAASRDRNETLRLTHELEVHRIELELQNEELRQAQIELKANYDELYDSAPIGYFTLGRFGDIENANLTGADMLGLARARLPGQRFAAFVMPASRPEFNDFLERVFGEEGKRSCMLTLMKGGRTPIAAYIEAAGVGSGSSCRAAVVDVSSTRRAALALHENEARLKFALAASGTGVWEWHRDTGEIYWSPECFKILGLDRFSPTPAAVARLVHPEDAARVKEEARGALADAKVHTAEYRVLRPGGEVLWICSFAQAQYDDAGRPVCLIGTAQEVTERRRAGTNAASAS